MNREKLIRTRHRLVVCCATPRKSRGSSAPCRYYTISWPDVYNVSSALSQSGYIFAVDSGPPGSPVEPSNKSRANSVDVANRESQ